MTPFAGFLSNLLIESYLAMVVCVDTDMKEAVATYDFQGRSDKELSFHKGETLLLHDRISVDWWHGSTLTSRRGLVPDKYVTLRAR